MDIAYLAAGLVFWIAFVGLALGCERMQRRKPAP